MNKHLQKHWHIFEASKQGVLLGLCAVLLFGLASISGAWTAETQTAPAGNTKPPINSATSTQDKIGSISLGSLGVFGDSSFTRGIKITTGNPGVGKVLMSDESGVVRWETYANAKRIAKKYKCPKGSSLLTLENKTFCAYSRITGGYGYCDKFGQSYDPMVQCWDIGHGRNHGVSPYWNGCLAWEGEKNYGGQGAKFFCEKQIYIEKLASECTDRKAVVGTINDVSLSPNPITTCNILTPYTYKGCVEGRAVGNYCIPTSGKSFGTRSIGTLVDIQATSTTCPAGWMKYIDNCI